MQTSLGGGFYGVNLSYLIAGDCIIRWLDNTVGEKWVELSRESTAVPTNPTIREGLDKNCEVRDAGCEYVMVYWADIISKNHHHQGLGL